MRRALRCAVERCAGSRAAPREVETAGASRDEAPLRDGMGRAGVERAETRVSTIHGGAPPDERDVRPMGLIDLGESFASAAARPRGVKSSNCSFFSNHRPQRTLPGRGRRPAVPTESEKEDLRISRSRPRRGLSHIE